VSGHFDYARRMNAILEVVGIATWEPAELDEMDLPEQCSAVEQCPPGECATVSNVTCNSPMSDSAFGDEVEEAVEATEFMNLSDYSVHSHQ